MTCTHRIERSHYVEIKDDWHGGTYWEWQYTTEHSTKDIGVGAFQCTQCKEVMYYTGSWKKFYTEGVPCPSSEYSEKTGDVHKVRAAIKEKNAAYITAASPDVVLKMIETTDTLRAHAPQPAEPLTDDEIEAVYLKTYNEGFNGRNIEIAFARAIIKATSEKANSVATMVCKKCGADRFQSSCKGSLSDCPITAVANENLKP